ncbi:MAG: DUF2225 domain-containing protein [Peptococcaceae bacterium]|nr:DUF2225 domain-containing protein [Peptococcaceae bacterium]
MVAEAEMIFEKSFTCPCCSQETLSPAVKSRYVVVTKTDTDFCSHFSGINPYFYEVVVCQHCGYAFTERCMEALNADQRATIKRIVNWDGKTFAGVRDHKKAVASFIAALYCQENIDARMSIRGGLCLKLAWLHRYIADTQQENRFLHMAYECFTDAYNNEVLGPKEEIHLLYLLGEIGHRLGKPLQECLKWFNKAIQHPRKDAYPLGTKMARERWQEIKWEQKNRSS